MNSVKYLLFYMELFCDMFESVLECYELTHISWSLSAGVMQEWACIVSPLVVHIKHENPLSIYENVDYFQIMSITNLEWFCINCSMIW